MKLFPLILLNNFNHVTPQKTTKIATKTIVNGQTYLLVYIYFLKLNKAEIITPAKTIIPIIDKESLIKFVKSVELIKSTTFKIQIIATFTTTTTNPTKIIFIAPFIYKYYTSPFARFKRVLKNNAMRAFVSAGWRRSWN